MGRLYPLPSHVPNLVRKYSRMRPNGKTSIAARDARELAFQVKRLEKRIETLLDARQRELAVPDTSKELLEAVTALLAARRVFTHSADIIWDQLEHAVARASHPR